VLNTSGRLMEFLPTLLNSKIVWTLTRLLGTGWENTEHRSYQFLGLEDPNASLKETSPSRRERRGSAIPLTHAEQVQLRQAFSQELEEEYRRLSGEQERPKHQL
jgi:hypothetical protein